MKVRDELSSQESESDSDSNSDSESDSSDSSDSESKETDEPKTDEIHSIEYAKTGRATW